MSWSVENKCSDCKSLCNGCMDGFLIYNAANIAHQLGTEKGHLGGGIISMNCQNYIPND